MKISKEEIEQAASARYKYKRENYGNPQYIDFHGTVGDFIAGADWMYQRLEPLITDLSMDKARRRGKSINGTNILALGTWVVLDGTEQDFQVIDYDVLQDQYKIDKNGSWQTVDANRLSVDYRFAVPQSEVMTLEECLDQWSGLPIGKNEEDWYPRKAVLRAMEEYALQVAAQCQSDRDEAEQKIGKLEAKVKRYEDALDIFNKANYESILPGHTRLSNYSEGYNAAIRECKQIATQALQSTEPKDTKE